MSVDFIELFDFWLWGMGVRVKVTCYSGKAL